MRVTTRRFFVTVTCLGVLTQTAGCAWLFQGSPEAPSKQAEQLKLAGPTLEELQRETHRRFRPNPLWVKETGARGLPLGANKETVRLRWGKPERVAASNRGEWWEYEEVSATLPGARAKEEGLGGDVPQTGLHVKLFFADAAEPVVNHIQVWAPSRLQTRTFLRPLDPATRVIRKYGPPAASLRWGFGGGEVWIYPAADVAYVVTPEHPQQPRAIAAILMGLQPPVQERPSP
ncbi:MAG: hypothetical protein VKP62_01590 [Candidatus Sericytochromatia bacterium]|nr:hypothetical protein [Candidatus Sericytochromatia bacterium]